MRGYRLADGAGCEAVDSYDDEAASSGDDLFYEADTGARRPRHDHRLFYDTADEINIKITRCERICTALYGLAADIEDSTYSKQILDDMRRHATDVEKKVTLYTNKFHSMFRKFFSFDNPQRVIEARTDALMLNNDITEFLRLP